MATIEELLAAGATFEPIPAAAPQTTTADELLRQGAHFETAPSATGVPPGAVPGAPVVPSPAPGVPAFAQTAAPDTQEPGFLERIQPQLLERLGMAQQARAATESGEQTTAEGIMQVAGQGVLGAGFDVAGEAIMTVAEPVVRNVVGGVENFLVRPALAIVDTVRPGTSDEIFEVLGHAVDSDVVAGAKKALAQGQQAFEQWEQDNPRAARNLRGATNIALAAIPAPAGRGVQALGPVGRTGERAVAAGAAQQATRRTAFLQDLIRPKATPTVRREQIGRTAEGGVFRGRQIEPSLREADIADAVSTVEGVRPNQTQLENLRAIDDAARNEADELRTSLEGSTVRIPSRLINKKFQDVRGELATNPLLVGDAEKIAEKTIQRAQEFLVAEANTPAGMLRARKKFDAWVRRQKPKALQGEGASALDTAVLATRRAINDVIADEVPDVAVRASLRRQNLLLEGIENIGPKAADEAGSAILRLKDRVGSIVNLKESIAALGAAGLGLGFAPTTTLATAATIGAGVGAVKLATSPATKRAVGELLKASEKAIVKTTDPATLSQLRLDRAAVLEIFDTLTVANNGKGKK